MSMGRRRWSGVGLVAVIACVGTVAGCSAAKTATPPTATPLADRTLTVLVTNDDGVGAPGIDAVVNGLRALSHTQVTVVAPATNQSGTGSKTTPGTLTATKAKTASGYPAM